MNSVRDVLGDDKGTCRLSYKWVSGLVGYEIKNLGWPPTDSGGIMWLRWNINLLYQVSL